MSSRLRDARSLGVVAITLAACGGSATTPSPPPSDVQPSYDYPKDDQLRLDHLQAKATHNSYHVEPPNNDLQAWNYTHLPLDRQLDEQGVRQVELDLYFEEGTFRVFHLKLIDDRSTCDTLAECLAALKGWSDAHRGHHPLVVQLELKSEPKGDPEPYFEELHRTILSVWPEPRIVTPAFVQGDHGSVAEALASGWPTLGKLRGKVLFAIDNKGELQRAYTHDRKDLDGRLLFPDSDPGDPFAAYLVANDPVGDADRIAKGLAAHLLVRTRSDGDGVEAKANDPTKRDAALASGAHFISTDYPAKRPDFAYWVDIPGGTPSRCNPVTAPADCVSEDLERPALLDSP
ncbi:MAG: hypothetical protein FJ096_06250 [Deltaproteobacteria bacterium]|nr:hypothetical protein [Deltaproteobacteria bacterium]